MKLKRRRVLEVPPKIKSFINSVTAASFENIEEPLKGFVWEFDKGDFHHWVDLFNHFDSYFEKHIKPRKDLQVEDNFLEADPPFPREAVLQILRVIRIILENCTNKHFYSSFEQHLSSLLASTDADVVEASLQTLAAFLKKTVGKCSIRDASLNSKLFAFSQGWGGKEEGLGLIACSVENGCDSVAYELGCTLHFEFYSVNDSSKEPSDSEPLVRGLQVIHLPNINSRDENDLELLNKLVMEYKVPASLRFSLLTRLRFARAFGSLASRQQYICIRLYAFVVLVQASNDADDLAAFFNNEPEFINELVSLLSYEDAVPEKIRILGILSLVALCQDRSRQPTVLTAVTSGGHRGILPSLMQKAIDSITTSSSRWSVVFAEALLSLVTVLVSSSSGCSALREAGLIPTLLPLLKDTSPQHLHSVSTAVHVLEAFMDYSNPAAALFRDLGGLDDTIARLKVEVSYVEKGSKQQVEDSHRDSKGKQVIGTSDELDTQPLYSEALVSYHRRLLMKALLRAISLGTYAPGTTARIYGSEESLLPHCLCIIFRRAKDFGGGVFSLAAIVMSDLIHKDPTCFPVLDAADLPRAFLDAIMGGVLCSAEAVTCIPQCLDALCLNNIGLQAVKDRNALRCFVKIFTSRTYLRALTGDTPGTLSSGLDELMRHASSLRGPGVDMLIEILNTISKIGSGAESSSSSIDPQGPSTAVPMETDTEERILVSSDEGDSSKMDSSEQITEADISSVNIESVNVESFLPECITNASRLLETILQNADTCRIFIEKKGIEAVLQLFTLPLLPLSASVGQSISVAFKNFSPQHSAALARAMCMFLREHLKSTNDLLISVGGSQLAQLEGAKQTEVLRCLSSLEGLLSLANFLLKGTTTMLSELSSADADVLTDLGKAYKEVLWHISLCSDSKVGEKREIDQETGIADAVIPNATGRESDDDGNLVPIVRYMNPVSLRNGPGSLWSGEQEFLSVVRSGEGVHRHGRHGLTRTRGGRTGRQLDVSLNDSESSAIASETSLVQDAKKKSPDVLVSEILNKLAFAIRSFHATLVKGFTAPNRRRADSGSLSSASRSLATALAKIFHEALSYSGHSTSAAGLEMSLSVKCRYLGKVVDDMVALTFDSRRRACNTALVNNFYVHGTFKELLTTFEATSQLLWTLPYSIPAPGSDQGKTVEGNKLSHSLWLLDTLQSYCRMLEYFVNSSLLLSPTSSSQAQLLVQPVAAGLSIGLFSVPKDPEVFVRMLQSQVLDVILPVWNHPMFPNCSPTFITSMVSLVTHIYSGVGDVKRSRNGITGSTNQRFVGPPPDESTIATIVEMGFSRARAEEALRRVETNSVEMAMEWLFSHAEDPVQEDDELARALALSLGNSSDTSKEDSGDKTRDVMAEEREAEAPPIDDVLAAAMKLFQSSDAMAFPLTDLLVTLCNRNKGEDRPRVALYLIQQLKLCPSDFSKDTGALCTISHILALLLSEDSSTREIAAENGIVSAALDILTNFKSRTDSKEEGSAPKCISALFLILDNMLQSKPRVSSENTEGNLSGSLADSSGEDASLSLSVSVTESKSTSQGHDKETGNVFEKILGKSTGYLTLEQSHRVLEIACEFIKQHVPAMVMQAVLQLCARLTKTHAIAMQFLENGGLAALFSLPRSCFFLGFDSVASAIIRHLLEDPQTLQTAMELEIRQTLSGTLSRQAGRPLPRTFLTSMAPVISRDPVIFMRAAAAVCQLETSGGRMNIVLSKEKDKEKEKSKAFGVEVGVSSNECVRMPESKIQEGSGKCTKGHKRIPASLTQVIDQLLEIVMSYPSARKQEECTSSLAPMEVDEPATKEKGKSKVDDTKMEHDSLSERSTALAKVTFVLKLMSDILLMYVHAVGVVLRRDSETCQLRGSCQLDGSGHGGILHHVLHQLLPLSSDKTAVSLDKTAEASVEWRDKLSEKASWFLVVLCGRSGEGRRRVISEIVRAFSSFSSSGSNSSKGILLPNKKVLAFADLVNSILSKNSSSSNLPGPGCSPDIAKTMIDGGMIQSLTSVLQVIDLDHPDAPKIVNLILKALESLTRAANANEQVFKSEGLNKKKRSGMNGRAEDQTNAIAGGESVEHDQNANSQHQTTDAVGTEQQLQGTSHNDTVRDANLNQSMEPDMRIEMEETMTAHPPMEHGVEFMREEMDEGGVLHNTNVGMTFRVERRTDDDMGDEDDEDMGEDGEDDDEEDDEEDDEDEDIAEEGAALMSLADTDVEDHDDNGLGDEYNDDMIDEEDDDFHENRVIEVRWREGLDGLDHLQVLGRPGAASGLIDVAAEPFQGVNVDDIFGFRRPLGERRRQTGNRNFVERSGLEGTAFQHPLLRPSQSGDPNVSMWSSAGTGSRDLEALSVGNFDVTHFYMFDAPVLPSEHAAATIFGDRLVGAPPPLLDFSLGMDPMHLAGRRGPGDGRWTDDGQPQAGSQAAAIAQAVEEQFISQLRSVAPSSNRLTQRQSENPGRLENQQSDIPPSNVDSQPQYADDNVASQQTEAQHQDLGTSSVHPQENPTVEGDSCLPISFLDGCVNSESVLREAEGPQAAEPMSTHPDGLNSISNESESMQIGEGPITNIGRLETIPEFVTTSADLHSMDPPSQDVSEMFGNAHDSGPLSTSGDVLLGTESQSSSQALVGSSAEILHAGDGAASVEVGVDVDMDGVPTVRNPVEHTVPVSYNAADDPSAQQSTEVAQDANQPDQININNEGSSTNTIDPTFLEALPEDLRAEVLASQQAQSVPAPTYAPPSAEDIDPEFLAALPPDIQAEVLAQQRAQRAVQSQQAEGQPVDMDNASIIATFPADLREEVLLTSSEAVLSALPSPLLAEAQMLRDRAMSHYQARSLFGGSHRLGGRRNSLGIDRQTVMDRGVGVTIGRRAVSAIANSLKVKEIEGTPLLDANALRALIQLLRLAQVEASDLVSTERNFETTLSTEKIEAVTLKSDENPNEVIDSSPIETPSGEETKQEGGGAEHQEAIGFVSEEKSRELDIPTEDAEDKKLERALESVSEEGGPSKIEILNDDGSPDKTVDALPDSRASVQESTQKETPQVEDEQCRKEPNEVSESAESTVVEEVKAANGTESEQLETSCEFGSEDKSKQTDTGNNRADDMAKEEETLYADMEEDRTESKKLQEPSQTSVGLKTAVADENTENQITEQKSSVADIDTVFVGVEAVEETIQEDENESMKVGEAAAELETEGQTSETKETNETATNRVHVKEASMGLGAADSSENIEKHMIGEDEAAKELDTIPVRGEVPSLETNDADDTTKTGIPSEKIENLIVEDDKASHKNIDVFPVTTTLPEEITREEACNAKEEIHETISANERNVEVATDEVRISEGPIKVEKVSTFDDSDSICEKSNLSDAAEAPNLKDDEVLNRSPDVSAIAKASGVEILRKENATVASIWVPEEITEAAFEKAAAGESFSKGEIEREKLKEEVIYQTRETETSKHEENQQMGLDSPPIPKASAVEILQKEGEKPDKASDLESDEQIQEIISPKDVEEIHTPRPEESTDELQDPKKLQDTTNVVLEELGHEKVGARETAEIAIEEEENPQKNIDGLSVTHASDEGGKIEEATDLLPEAPSHETVTAIDSTDPAPTETTTLESKEENVKFVTIPESVTLTAEESLNRSFDVFSFPQASGEETSQIEGSEKHAGSKEILQDNENKATLQNSCDLIEKTSQKAIVEDRKLGEATEVEADLKGAKLEEKQDRAAEERTEALTEDSIEELKESDSGKVRLSDLLERSKRDNMKMPADLIQERHPAVNEDELRNKQAAAHQAEEEKSDEEEEEDDEHKKDESGSDAPVIVEASRDIDLKPPHKKSHNILSGVGSKVKHSIAKVKKAITGKSTHPKSLPAK